MTKYNLGKLSYITCLVLSLIPFTSYVSKQNTLAADEKINTENKDNKEKKSALPVEKPNYPGAYKTLEKDGVEWKLSRFPQGKFGGTLIRVIAGTDPKTFNWWTAEDTISRELAGLMFRGLAEIDSYTGQTTPDLAAEIKILPDKLTYITRLRKGLNWSDGKPITSEDVAYTWNTIIASAYGNSSIRDIAQIDGKMPTCIAVDKYTNKFVTAKPSASFNRLLSVPIAPKHIVEPIISQKDGRNKFQQLWSASNFAAKNFVTNGPFTVSEFLPAQRVELTKTKNFYMLNNKLEQLPYLNRIVYSIVPNVNTLLLKFESKELDISQLRARDIPNLLASQKKNNFTIHNLGPSNGTLFLVFNMNRRIDPKTQKPFVDPIKSTWFNDLNFRQAINHTINRRRIVDNYFKGIGSELFVSEPSASPFRNQLLKSFQPDLAYANKLLTQAGFTKKNDNLLYDRKGNKVEFDLLYATGGTFYPATANMLVADLKQLGIKVNLQELNFNVIQNLMESKKNWQAQLFALSGDPLDPNDARNVFNSNGRLHIFDQRELNSQGKILVNDSRPWEKRIDQIFEQAAVELDFNKRKKLYDEYQQIIYDQAPFIYLVSPTTLIGARNTIKNYAPTPLSQDVVGLHNIEEIYMNTEQTK